MAEDNTKRLILAGYKPVRQGFIIERIRLIATRLKNIAATDEIFGYYFQVAPPPPIYDLRIRCYTPKILIGGRGVGGSRLFFGVSSFLQKDPHLPHKTGQKNPRLVVYH